MGDVAHGCRAWKINSLTQDCTPVPRTGPGWMSRVGSGRVRWLNHHHLQDCLWTLCHCGLKERKTKKRCSLGLGTPWTCLAHPRPDAPRQTSIHTHNPVVNQSPSHPIYGVCLEYSAGKECESLVCFFQGGEPGSGFSDDWTAAKNKRMSSRVARPRIDGWRCRNTYWKCDGRWRGCCETWIDEWDLLTSWSKHRLVFAL